MSQVRYVLDSSCLIKLNRDQPLELYPSVWEKVDDLTGAGWAILPSEAKREIDHKDDALKAWVKLRPAIVVEATIDDLALVQAISAAHPDWVQGRKNAADPFIIAAAVVHGGVIVTDEKFAGPGAVGTNVRLPNVAAEHGIECIGFTDLVRREQWRF